ncbi:MAG: complexin-2 [Eubacteriales bacterium]|nr:complexin-2 [Eubacteriales bacterium]
MKRKNVQLSFELFAALVKFHLLQDASYENEIKEGLEKKLDALVNHELYARYKTAPTAEEKEKARLEYLDKRGIQEEFRW